MFGLGNREHGVSLFIWEQKEKTLEEGGFKEEEGKWDTGLAMGSGLPIRHSSGDGIAKETKCHKLCALILPVKCVRYVSS